MGCDSCVGVEQGLKEKKLIEANLDRVDKLKPIAKVLPLKQLHSLSLLISCLSASPHQLAMPIAARLIGCHI